MTLYVYPRLPLAAAVFRLGEIQAAYARGGLDAVKALSAASHLKASPVATGGTVAGVSQCVHVRKCVLESLSPWLDSKPIVRSRAADFDRALGQVLHNQLQIVPADASYDETWSFLTLVLLPDICVARFSDMHRDRMIGTQRNALRRTWLREEVLGEMARSDNRALGEDELVGLFERTALARNRVLLRVLAAHVMAYTGEGSRSNWARKLYVRVTYATGPRLLDALDAEELEKIVLESISQIE